MSRHRKAHAALGRVYDDFEVSGGKMITVSRRRRAHAVLDRVCDYLEKCERIAQKNDHDEQMQKSARSACLNL